MTPLFPRWATRAFRYGLAAAVAVAGGVPLGLMVWVRTPAAQGRGAQVAQPVPFSHQVHVTGLRIDCRYCHASVERAASAGIPPTATCVPCHNQVWLDGALFRPVRASLASRRPIAWRRVNALPDFVFFNHGIHTRKGVACETCHGRVDQMAVVHQTAPLTMGWCLSCHRDPAPHLRPVEQVTAMGWSPPSHSGAIGAELARRYHVRSLTDCSTCHR